ncbi:MAG: DUF1501 domain-containing protein [Pedosphaera sp.]|nr:DUF1501 domain-containing protein [Pedosphaera sp.]
MERREFIRVGLGGFGALTLPGLLRLRAQATERPVETAVILVWLRGGCSHLDTYDPKPEAPIEFRGPFQTLATRVPGLRLTELLPRHAKIADKFTLLRSMSHTGGGHPAGSLQMLTGDTDPADKRKPVFPDWMSVTNLLRRSRRKTVPNYVGVNPVAGYDGFQIAGSAYVNPAYGPFSVTGDPSLPNFVVPNIGLKENGQVETLRDRVALRQSLDRLSRAADRHGSMGALDDFEAQALTLLTHPSARDAFDLSREPDALRDRYGRNAWGQQCLMARRLVEAGVSVVTTTFDGPLCGRVNNWDDHSVNQHIFDALKYRMPVVDQAVTALIEDIHDRGMNKNVMVIVSGEFGRTPRITHVASSGGGVASGPEGTIQPGRDHWPNAFTMLWSGGGIPTGRVIGSTDEKGEYPAERPCGPGDFLATVYHHLGIDAAHETIPDFSGRPISILPIGKPIPELCRTA